MRIRPTSLLIGATIGAFMGYFLGGSENASNKTQWSTVTAWQSTEMYQLSPQDALRRAVRAGLSPEVLASMIADLVRDDGVAALEILGRLPDQAQTESVAAAVLVTLSPTVENLDLILREISPTESLPQARMRVIAALAGSHPRDALDLAYQLEERQQRIRARTEVAVAWANTDPTAAIDYIESRADLAERGVVLQAVFRAWSLKDPMAALSQYDRLRSLGMRQSVADFAAAEQLAYQDPESLLRLAQSLASLPAADNARRMALVELAKRDSNTAFAYVDEYSNYVTREADLAAVVEGWARQDMASALRWVRAQPKTNGVLEGAVYQVIAETDISRALDFALESNRGNAHTAEVINDVVTSALQVDPSAASLVAEAVFQINTPELREQALAVVINRWKLDSPNDALRWLITNSTQVSSQLFDSMGTAIGAVGRDRLDAATAASFVDRVPAGARTSWITRIGYAFAREDPEAGVAWVEELRSLPDYTTAVASVAQGLAEADPRAAVDLLDRVQLEGGASVTVRSLVANRWSQQDPEAAFRWAQTLSESQGRSSIQAGVVRAWYRSQPDAAKSRVLEMPTGAERDAVLTGLLTATARPGGASASLDPTLLGAFSSELSRQERLEPLLPQLSLVNPPAARNLVDQYFTDPEKRAQAEKLLDDAERGRRAARGVIASGGGNILRLPPD